VQFEAGGAGVQVRVKDHGPGMADAALAQPLGSLADLGLRTVSKRLQMAFGARAALALRAREGGGFAAAFRVPVQTTLAES
jgi:sensor histidine kinase YesM